MILEEPLSYPYAALAFLADGDGARTTHELLDRGGDRALRSSAASSAASSASYPSCSSSRPGCTRCRARRRGAGARTFTAWDWVGAIVLGAGAVILFSGLVGKFSQSWAIATGHYQGRMLDYGPAGGRGADDRARPAARSSPRSPTLGDLEGRRADARAPRLHEPVRRGRGRLRCLHGGQDRVPVDRRLHARRGAEPDLPRAARLRRDGAVDRPSARALGAAGGRGRVRRLPDRGDAVPADDRSGERLARRGDRADGEPQPRRSRTEASSGR